MNKKILEAKVFKQPLLRRIIKHKAAIILGIAGILIMLTAKVAAASMQNNGDASINSGKSSTTPTATAEPKTFNFTPYETYLEGKITAFVSAIDGAGKVSAIVYTTSSIKYIAALDSDSTEISAPDEGKQSVASDKHVILKDALGNENIVILQELYPEICGIAVKASGAENAVIREKIINSLCAAFGVAAHRINVTW